MIIRNKDIMKMNNKEIDDKLKELKYELIKSRVGSAKGAKIKTREIKKTIARLYTFNRQKTGKESFKKLPKPVETVKKTVAKKSIKK